MIASKNSFALTLLAAKYAYEAREDEGRLFKLKRKVLELSLKSGVDKDVIMKTFIFVKEFMTLPEEKERLFRLVQWVMDERKRSQFYAERGKKRRRCRSIGEAF